MTWSEQPLTQQVNSIMVGWEIFVLGFFSNVLLIMSQTNVLSVHSLPSASRSIVTDKKQQENTVSVYAIRIWVFP